MLPLDEVSQSVSQSVSRARLTAQQSLTYLDEVDILEKLETDGPLEIASRPSLRSSLVVGEPSAIPSSPGAITDSSRSFPWTPLTYLG